MPVDIAEHQMQTGLQARVAFEALIANICDLPLTAGEHLRIIEALLTLPYSNISLEKGQPSDPAIFLLTLYRGYIEDLGSFSSPTDCLCLRALAMME